MGLTLNGCAVLALIVLFWRGYAATRIGLCLAVIAGASLPLFGPVASGLSRVITGVAPLLNSIGAAGGAVG